MIRERIISLLKRRPYWGPQTVAKAVGASPQVVRVTASRAGIKFMDRYEVEREMDKLVEALEKVQPPPPPDG